MARKRVTYRPSKTGSAFGGIVGIIFVLIGLFVIIPTSSMAGGFALIFGILWTAIAAGITIMNFYQAFGKKYVGPEIHIEEEETRRAFLTCPELRKDHDLERSNNGVTFILL